VRRVRDLPAADRARIKDSLVRIGKTPEGRGHQVAKRLSAELGK
jgi:hypothetical protein